MKKKLSRNHDSFWFRNGLTIISLVVFIFIISVCEYFFMDDIYLVHTKLDLRRAATEIASLDLKSEKVNSKLSDIEAAYNIYLEIYHPRDKLVYTSENNTSIFENNSSDKESKEMKPRIMKILEHDDFDDESYFEFRQEYFATAKYIVFGTYLDNDSALEIYYSYDTMLSSAETTTKVMFIIGGLILLIFLLVLVIYTYTFTVPLVKINNTTKRIAEMDFSNVCPPFRIRELDELSSSVNALSSSLDLSMKELKKKNRQLELEIEKQRMLEESRRQFTANASHELKTPLAIIQGYAEGLKVGITSGNAEEYCDVIMDEAEKMSSLVISLLEASKYERLDYEPQYIDFSINGKINDLVEARQTVYRDKGIEVIVNINNSFIGRADMDLFERAFGNYFSNAVSHADFEKKIRITCEQAGDSYRISVFNTGKPIADEDIGKIWGSFYRADKAHSRSEGRFGLGLSIVANAQRLQGEKFGVENHENGVEFWFDVAICK